MRFTMTESNMVWIGVDKPIHNETTGMGGTYRTARVDITPCKDIPKRPSNYEPPSLVEFEFRGDDFYLMWKVKVEELKALIENYDVMLAKNTSS